jgi:DNA-binding transcriptional LysR family regulator
MGEMYLAQHPRLTRRRDALKLLGRDLSAAVAVGSLTGVEPRRYASDRLVRRAFRRHIDRPIHHVPTAEGFGAAVRAGLGWGMFPGSLAASESASGVFARISDVHLEVPLFWQCWKLYSPTVESVTDAVRSAAGELTFRK